MIILVTFILLLNLSNTFYQQESPLRESVENHNMINSDRINLIFLDNYVQESYKNYFNFIFKQLIGWDGPFFAKHEENKVLINYGFFGTDPVRNYKDKFNIWLIDDKTSISNLPLNNKVVIKMNLNNSSVSASSSEFVSDSEQKSFKSVTMDDLFNIDSIFKISKTLNHELGHALFNLNDEYFIKSNDLNINENYNLPARSLYDKYIQNSPNCALNLISAKEKWGKYIGKVDSFYYEIQDDLKKFNINHESGFDEESFRLISGVPFSCDSGTNSLVVDDKKHFKPTFTSYMDTEYNRFSTFKYVYGEVNKQTAIKILESYKGTGRSIPFSKLELSQDNYEKVKSNSIYSLEMKKREQLGIKLACFYCYEEEKTDEQLFIPYKNGVVFLIEKKYLYYIFTYIDLIFILYLLSHLSQPTLQQTKTSQ